MKKKIGIFTAAILLLVGIAALSYTSLLRWVYPIKYQAFVEQVATENDLSSSLIYAVIHTESGFRPEAVSNVGARGLMQLTEETFEWVRYRMDDPTTQYGDLYDPETNIRYGGWLLRLLLDEFDTIENTLCAYHAGWGTTQKWLSDPAFAPDGKQITNIPFPGTAHYQQKVLRALGCYQQLYPSA